jgi:hypothetical protein
VNKLYCPQCGEKLETSDQKFCKHCGADLRIDIGTSDSPVSAIKENKIRKQSKRCFILGLSSFFIAIIFIIIGIFLIILLRSSVYPHFTSTMVQEQYYFDQELKMYTNLFGLIAILFSIAGFSLAIISKMKRKKMRDNGSKNILIDMGGVFAILGIVLNIIAIIMALIVMYLPFFVGIYWNLWEKSHGLY